MLNNYPHGSSAWKGQIDSCWYRHYSHEYWEKERPVIARVSATDEQLKAG